MSRARDLLESFEQEQRGKWGLQGFTFNASSAKKRVNREFGFVIPKEFKGADRVNVHRHNNVDMALAGGGAKGRVIDFFGTGMAIKFNAALVNNGGFKGGDLVFVTLPKNKKVDGTIRMEVVDVDTKTTNSGLVYFAAANSALMSSEGDRI